MSIVDDAAVLAGLTDAWLELLARSDADEPMLAPPWLAPWWEVFGGEGGRTLRVVTFREHDRLVGLVPLCARRVSLAPGLRLRRLEALGTGEAEVDEVCSDHLGVIAARGRTRAVADAFAAALADGLVGGIVDELVIPAIAADSASFVELPRALRRQGWHVRLVAMPAAPYIPLPAKFDDYLTALPQRRRAMVRRSLRDFDKLAGGREQLHEARDEASLAEGLRVLASLHGERWGGGGAFASERFTRFHELATRRLLARGALELLWLSLDGEPVAAVYNLVWNRKVYFYQAGRKMDLPGKQRPGVVLHARAIQRAIAAGRREYDFLAGISRYKMDLALATRPLYTLRAARPGWRAAAHDLLDSARAGARRLRERWRTRGVTPAAPPAESESDDT